MARRKVLSLVHHRLNQETFEGTSVSFSCQQGKDQCLSGVGFWFGFFVLLQYKQANFAVKFAFRK